MRIGWRRLLASLSLLLTVVFIATGCSSSDNDAKKNKGPNKIRIAAVKEAAMTYGAQYGLAWRSETINNITEAHQLELDHIYNFNRLLLPHHLMPPVLVEAKDSLSLSSPNTIRLSDRTVEIQRPAMFVTTTPSWRDYIHMNFEKPERPNPAVLPVDDEERIVWDRYVQIGWQKGIDQAEIILETSLAQLNTDYKGMLLYQKLLSEHMVSQPYVAKADLGTTGNTARMRLNDRVVRITQPSMLTPENSHEWQPILVVEEPNTATPAAPITKNETGTEHG